MLMFEWWQILSNYLLCNMLIYYHMTYEKVLQARQYLHTIIEYKYQWNSIYTGLDGTVAMSLANGQVVWVHSSSMAKRQIVI